MNSSSASSASSSPPLSPSSPLSPTATLYTHPPTLERLIQHFTASKRSLTSSAYVWRANELVTNSRALVEEIAVLNARNSFTKRGVDEQVERLENIKDRIAGVGVEAGEEFGRLIERLDRGNERLERTLVGLRRTIVEANLQRTSGARDGEDEPKGERQDVEDGSGLQSEVETTQEKTLYDFINPSQHEHLQSSLRQDIDTVNESRSDLDSTVEKLEDSLRTITDILSDKPSNPTDKPTLYDEPPPSISTLFHSISDHAAEMANLLGSLVKHYDLCVTALKHTEGGGEAAKRAAQQTEMPSANGAQHGALDGTGAPLAESLYLKTNPEPISDEEREDMLRVLEVDSQEVSNVVSELRERNAEQEALFSQLSDGYARKARARDTALREVLEMLHEMRDLHLPSHLYALDSFRAAWKRIQASIEDKTSDLLSLAARNESFLAAYAQLLREVERRKTVETQVLRVADKANKELKRIFDIDAEARREFVDEFGDFLPRGIWGAAEEEGVGWELREIGGKG